MSGFDQFADLFYRAQRRLVARFEEIDGRARFVPAPWQRATLGAGTARVLEHGDILERAGINVSVIHGERAPESLTTTRPDIAGRPFKATGISMVMHPRNPYAPSFHANFRYFEVADTACDGWWIGGGADMTPSYGFEQDATHFHRTLKALCDRHDPRWYPAWKESCDEYFLIGHRREMRGIGGIFFDRLSESSDGVTGAKALALVEDALDTVLCAYEPILRIRSTMAYGEDERAWQLLRRGRYVEFNLVYDRGTRFGLQTNGNIEAIMMSMPPLAGWAFDVTPQPGSAEADLHDRFLQPRNWIDCEPVLTGSSNHATEAAG
jgi:coproporphyrinogen III oxidase